MKNKIISWCKCNKLLFCEVCIILCILLTLLFVNFKSLATWMYGNADDSIGKLITLLGAFMGGILFSISLYYSNRRIKQMIKQNENAQDQIQIAQNQLKTVAKANVDTRFNNAVGHLGHSNPAVVLGGIHALFQIAVENENYTEVIHNLFCSYLRENSAKLYPHLKNKAHKQSFISQRSKSSQSENIKCPEIIQTIINYLFKANNEEYIFKGYISDLSGSTIISCRFYDAKLDYCSFIDAKLDDCFFYDAKLDDCFFYGAKLENCDFDKAKLDDCNFDSAKLENCDFDSAKLENCCFRSAQLKKCYFDGAELDNCNFDSAKLKDCYFRNAKMLNCNTQDTTLINTILPPSE